MRQVINAILYILVSGIQWRMLPKDYPKWQSVYHYFRQWRDDGTWQRIHDTLLAAVLPRREFDSEEALALLHYVQRRNAVAAAAHRKRQEAWMVERERIVTADAP